MKARLTVPELVAPTVPQRLRVPATAVALIGLGTHLAFVGLFALVDVWPMAVINVGSALLFALVFVFVRQSRMHLALVLANVEIAAHQACAVHTIGWDAGFQYFLLAACPLALLASGRWRWLRIGLPLAQFAVYGALLARYLDAHPPYTLDPTLLGVLSQGNLVASFLMLWAFALLYHRGAELTERALDDERARSDHLLHNILPPSIAQRLRRRPGVLADEFSEASVLFADLVGFTPLAQRKKPEELVLLLDGVFAAFDDLVEARRLEKIKTIGDAYMVAAGVPYARRDHAAAMADLALAMRERFGELAAELDEGLEMRIGIHTGPVVAGVIGKSKFAYDLWGDAVNTAARMESHGQPGRIHVSETTVAALGDGWVVEERGTIEVKGKGTMRTYWLEGRGEPASGRPALVA